MTPLDHALACRLRDRLASIEVACWRIHLRIAQPLSLLSRLRQSWSDALRYLDPGSHARYFPRTAQTPVDFIFRPAARAGSPASSPLVPIEWLLIGRQALADAPLLIQAWDRVELMGVGRMETHSLLHAATFIPWPEAAQAAPEEDPAALPCRLRFDMPVALSAGGASIIHRPTLEAIAVEGFSRVRRFVDGRIPASALDEDLRRVREAARACPCGPWTVPADEAAADPLHSAAMLQRGVRGWLELPEGAGPLGPLLAALQALHVGRMTQQGFGRLVIEPLTPARNEEP